MRSSGDIRAAFLDFFARRGHDVVSSSSLIPADDPSLLFTNAGMVQFKRVFLGEAKSPWLRAASCQKCMRAGGKHSDIENVGFTSRHHTFFEMLGNFSFGDYFKRDAIIFAWDLLIKDFGLPPEKLWVTVYEGDGDAAALWQEAAGVPAGRIVRMGAKDNFWQMADTGPCGPCSEIIIDQGPQVGCRRPGCAVGCDCDRYLELWNLVFMQYNRDESGRLDPLPKPSIDTGMGLERITAVLQGKLNNFDTDLFSGIIRAIEEASGTRYGAQGRPAGLSTAQGRPAGSGTDVSIRVIADHMRSITFLLSEGLAPSNEGRGYVLRRIIRRASRHARNLGMHGVFLAPLVHAVADGLGQEYPELRREAARARAVLAFEEERFASTLEQGSRLLEDVLKNLRARGGKTIPGAEIFRLYDTYGFPIDLVRDVAAEEGLDIDEAGFAGQMQTQKERARASWVQETNAAGSIYRELAQEAGSSVFTGYSELVSDAVVKAIIRNGRAMEEVQDGEEAEVVLDKTPFYGASGGQAGDTGIMRADGLTLEVLDTKKPVEELITHLVRVKGGKLDVWTRVRAEVDALRRRAAMRNHTATHLLQAALREILGEHVKQAGSLVDPERLRFDFTHFSPVDPVQIREAEDFVNARILEDIPVRTVEMRLEEAVAGGAMALFGEKYGERVRVVSVGNVSRELCGGTHVRATGEIGSFVIASEGSVASGIRRIEALTGFNALNYMRGKSKELGEIAAALKTDRPLERTLEITEKLKALEREINRLKVSSARDLAGGLLEEVRVIEGVKVLSGKVPEGDVGPGGLRDLADSIRDRLGSGVIVLAAADGSLLAMVTKDLSARLPAGQILKDVAAAAGGRGGGKPELAQGGTRELEKLDSALQKVYDIVQKGVRK